MLKRNGCVYTQVVKNCSAKELMPIIKDFAELGESEVFSDSWKAYDGLVDFLLRLRLQLCKKVRRLIIESSTLNLEFVNGINHINEIENFLGFASLLS